jgi:hypothetical protein
MFPAMPPHVAIGSKRYLMRPSDRNGDGSLAISDLMAVPLRYAPPGVVSMWKWCRKRSRETSCRSRLLAIGAKRDVSWSATAGVSSGCREAAAQRIGLFHSATIWRDGDSGRDGPQPTSETITNLRKTTSEGQ